MALDKAAVLKAVIGQMKDDLDKHGRALGDARAGATLVRPATPVEEERTNVPLGVPVAVSSSPSILRPRTPQPVAAACLA